MSKFSGKFDVYDWFYMIRDTKDQNLKNWKIYESYSVDDSNLLDIKTYKDLIPYFPRMINAGSSSKDGGTVYISIQSYVDRLHDKRLDLDLGMLIRYYKDCKTQNKPYDKEEAMKIVNWFQVHPELIELVERVEKYGENANTDGIKLQGSFKHYREVLFNEMVEAGYEEDYAKKWCSL